MSVTNVLGTSVAKPALVPWAVKLTIEYVIKHRISVAWRGRRDRNALVAELRAVHRDATEAASDLGTRVHTAAERRLLGTPQVIQRDVLPFVRQLDRFLRDWRVELAAQLEAAEITVMHRALGYAGTADLMLWLPTGPAGRWELWLIDFKSSLTRAAESAYPEYAQQLAALRYAEVAIAPDDTDVPMPPIERTGVLSLRRRSYALLPMPGDREAHRAFRGALVNARWHHAAPTTYSALLPPAGRSSATHTTREAA